MLRLTKQGPHADTEPCPLTFQYTQSAVPLARGESSPSIDLTRLLPLADTTLRTVRFSQGLTRALQVDIAAPAAGREAVQRLGRRSTRRSVVMQRLEFTEPPDRRSIGVFFSGYRPAGTNLSFTATIRPGRHRDH